MSYILSILLFPFHFLGKHKNLSLVLLILTISISPRIHMGTIGYGKSLDLRYEDLLLIIILFSWFVYSIIQQTRIHYSPLLKPILLYLAIAFLSTSIGIMVGWIEAERALFYYLKEVEYFVMFFIALNFINNYKDLKTAILAVLTGGIVNGLYCAYQFFSGEFKGAELGYYGVASIGEVTPFTVGAYFSLILILCATVLSLISDKKIKLLSFFSILMAGLGLVGSMSRSSIFATAIVLAVMSHFIFLTKRRTNRIQSLVLLILLAYVVFLGYDRLKKYEGIMMPIARIVNIENPDELYYEERWEPDYVPYLAVIRKSPIFGLGKSVTGTELPLEAHNHYIRILAEMGIVGIGVFLYLLFYILKRAYKVYINSSAPLEKAVGLSCFLITLVLSIASLAQDAFIPVKTTELFWITVGLMMVVNRWNQEKS